VGKTSYVQRVIYQREDTELAKHGAGRNVSITQKR